ncbi:MAG: retention module-containing protein, partial [Burkholderiaceae bacterium]|nr:retention module-containing protein [Burkholderiaceae bacterium]
MATRGQAAGIVKNITGKVTAVDASGNTRVLHAGDKVFEGEKVHAEGGTAHIELTQGGFATVGSGLTVTLDGALLSDAAKAAAEAAGTTPDQAQAPQMTAKEMEAIQEKIAQGGDPTQLLEAAAAGPGAGGGGSQEGGSFVIVEQNAARGEVTPGGVTTTALEGVGFGEILTAGAGGGVTPTLDLFGRDANGGLTIAVEGNDLVFTLGLSTASLGNVTANWHITVPAAGAHGEASYADFDASQFAANGITATDNGDGTWTLSGTVTIPAGAVTGEIRVPTYDDTTIEFDEGLTLTLDNVVGAVLPGGVTEIDFAGLIRDNDLLIGPVDPGNLDPNNPDSYVTDGTAAFAVEGDNLVFTVGQSSPSTEDTTIEWSVTVPTAGAHGEASYADFDASQFTANGITAKD